MKNLLLKEFKLCFLPINFIFLSFSSMLSIPNYPCYVAFFYLLMNCFWIFKNADFNKDLQYSLILPIKKTDIVKARCLSIAIYEVFFILLSIPFAFLNYKIMPSGNNAGIVPNFAFYGLMLIILSISRFLYFIIYYKKAEKHERSFLISILVFFVLYFICEFPVWMIYSEKFMQIGFIVKRDFASLLKQLPILTFGVLFYIFGWILTCTISSKQFKKVNL